MSTAHRLTAGLTTALVVSAIAVPAAGARALYDQPAKPAEPSPTVIRDGFDLGSAAIGAGSAFALLTAAGIAAVGSRRHRVRVAS